MSEITFYDRLGAAWQNNKVLATMVFTVALTLGAIKAYTEITDFAMSFSSRQRELDAFNNLVQPIYFKKRYARLAPGQELHLAQIAVKLEELKPNIIILKSHTDRVQPAPNTALSKTRGEWIAGHLRFYLDPVFRTEYVVIALGGSESSAADDDYSQRVNISISDDRSTLAGATIISTNAR
ncbi:hypothetical protein [Sinorhizobium meliloti]|uniref:Uncharacterized protein n=1 Tax=Rhizobium meliloti TaxID=382 RepID=A0A2J0Z0E2_RHIML|nr:hypothetical protein [Sinorhizobium meliloti]PJR13989.1 hypothetical protein CEJ86_19820 [Sinorhizobium meliloti]